MSFDPTPGVKKTGILALAALLLLLGFLLWGLLPGIHMTVLAVLVGVGCWPSK